MRLRPLTVLLLATTLLATSASGAQAASRGLSIGFLDRVFTADAPERAPWLGRAVDSGSDILRIPVGWVAPNVPVRPVGFDARNPADPAYSFARADAAIVDATSRGLRVLASFEGAPRWAEGPGRPASHARCAMFTKTPTLAWVLTALACVFAGMAVAEGGSEPTSLPARPRAGVVVTYEVVFQPTATFAPTPWPTIEPSPTPCSPTGAEAPRFGCTGNA